MTSSYVKNGIDIIVKQPQMIPLLSSANTVCLIGTAPLSKLARDSPHLIADFKDLKQLGDTGTLYQALSYAFLSGVFECYVVIAQESTDDKGVEKPAKQIEAIAGKLESMTGVFAALKSPRKPTLIAAPGFGSEGAVRNALDAVAGRVFCRYITETSDENEKKSVVDAKTRGSDREYLVDNGGYFAHGNGEVRLSPSAAALPALVARKPWESPEGFSLKLSRLAREIEYQPLAPAKTTESDRLNAEGVSNIVRGSSKPFILKGNRATSGRFISHQGIQDHVLRLASLSLEDNLGKNLRREFVDSLVARINSALKVIIANDGLEDVSVYLDPERNNQAELEGGRWYLRIDYSQYSVNENPVIVLTPAVALLEAD